MPRRALCALVLAAGCASTAQEVRNDQSRVPPRSAVVVGRLGLATRRPIRADRFELTAVQIGTGERWRIVFAPERDADRTSAPFFVHLPPGRYRLTRWAALEPERAWGGDDTGLAIDVREGRVACVGALYLKAREKAGFKLEDGAGSAPVDKADVRDECDDLGSLLRRRSPALSDAPEVRLAWAAR